MLRARLALSLLMLATGSCLAQQPNWAETGDPVVVFPDEGGTEHIWARADYVAWIATTRRGVNLTQELNSNPLFNTVAQLTGTNHQELAQAAIQDRVGYRFSAGLWLDPSASFGIEGSMLHLDRRPSTASVTPLDLNRLGTEAGAVGFSAITGGGGGTTVIPITAAGLINGAVVFEIDDLIVDDYQLLGRARVIGNSDIHLDALAGGRRLRVKESLAISAQASAQGLPVVAGTSVYTRDGIDAETTYTGVLLGLDCEANWHGWQIGIRPSATIAQVRNVVTTQALAQLTLPVVGTISFDAGSYLPLPGTNRGTSTDWTVIPEVDLRFARSFGSHIRLVLASSALVLPSVSRAGGQFAFGLPVARLLPSVGGIPQVDLLIPPARETLYLFNASAGIEIRF